MGNRMYHRQQNKCYLKGVYLPISKLHSISAVANLLAHNNKSKICYCCQISLQSTAVICIFFITDIYGGNIYFAGDGTYEGTTQKMPNQFDFHEFAQVDKYLPSPLSEHQYIYIYIYIY